MASLAFMLGGVPATDKVESADDKLRSDFKVFKEYEKSEDLKHFLELEQEVTSSEFALKKKSILKEKYKASEEFVKEKQYQNLSKQLEKLKHQVEKAKNKIKDDEVPESLKQLEKEEDELGNKVSELEKEINSEGFIKRKQYLTLKPKERYETTEEYKKENEYRELKNSEKVIWYFKTKKKYPFAEIERWDETFNEPFDNSSLNSDRWMTRYFWGDAILNEPYTMFDDKSFPTDGKNIEFFDNKLRLVTRKEEVEGKKWDPVHGFLQDSFEYSSGLISTGKSFRQKFGLFKAKIKLSSADLSQAFWMVSDGMIPHIDVVKYEKGKLYANYFWSADGGKSISKTGGSKYTSDFFIFSLEWTPDKLIWKINDKVFKTQSNDVPQEEMYMVFSAGLKEWGGESGLPSGMEIDWIRVYKLKESE